MLTLLVDAYHSQRYGVQFGPTGLDLGRRTVKLGPPQRAALRMVKVLAALHPSFLLAIIQPYAGCPPGFRQPPFLLEPRIFSILESTL